MLGHSLVCSICHFVYACTNIILYELPCIIIKFGILCYKSLSIVFSRFPWLFFEFVQDVRMGLSISTYTQKKNKMINNKCWWRCGRTGTLINCWWECKMVQPPCKTNWQFLSKLSIELSYDPVILLIDNNPTELKTYVPRNTCTGIFIAT